MVSLSLLMALWWVWVQFLYFSLTYSISSHQAGSNTAENLRIREKVSLEKNDECFKNFPPTAKSVSPRTFCAKWKGEDLEVSNGFSGAYYYPIDSSWFIQGIESESFVQKQDCDIRKHSVFSNVAHYVDWIHKIVKKDTDTKYKDIELQCNFVKNYEWVRF